MKTILKHTAPFLLAAVVIIALLGSCKEKTVTPKTVVVTFNSDGGTPAVLTVETAMNDRVKLPDYPTKSGYDLIGWYWAKDPSLLFDYEYARVNTNIELIAKWAPGTGKRYTVTFDARGGQPVPIPQSVIADNYARSPLEPFWMDPKVVNAFKGWYKDKALTVPFNFTKDKLSGDITLYAKWNNDV
ncbi:InlB B-repeat-containing protein [Spirosoma telluris]